MKQIIVFLSLFIGMLSCAKEGTLSILIHEEGNNTPIEGVTVTLEQVTGGTKKDKQPTNSTGECSFDLGWGRYYITMAKGNYDTKYDTIDYDPKDKKKTPYSYFLKRKPEILDFIILEDKKILDFGKSSPLEIFYFRNPNKDSVSWEVIYDCVWIKDIYPPSGILGNGDPEMITVIIDRTKFEKLDTNKTTISVRAKGAGGAPLTIRAINTGSVPEQPVITGGKENSCPDKTVRLEAHADGAVTFKWYQYKNTDTPVCVYEGKEFLAKDSGTYNYYAIGINEQGKEGVRSTSYLVTIKSCPPGQPTISGDTINKCPLTTVQLRADIGKEPDSYIWYKNSIEIPNENKKEYTVKDVGTDKYTVAGYLKGEDKGVQSAPYTVEINNCPTQASISPYSTTITNTCPDTFVKLTATVSTVGTTFIWKKDQNEKYSTANPLFVTEPGTYFVKAVNRSGEGAWSAERKIEIQSCVPAAPTLGLGAKMDGNNIKVSWNTVSFAQKYRVKMYDSNKIFKAEKEVTATSCTFKEDEGTLSCGTNNFEVVAINSRGQESPAATTNCVRKIEVTQAPKMDPFLGWSAPVISGTTKFSVEYIVERQIGSGDFTAIATTKERNYTKDESICKTAGFLTQISYRVKAIIKTDCETIESPQENMPFFYFCD